MRESVDRSEGPDEDVIRFPAPESLQVEQEVEIKPERGDSVQEWLERQLETDRYGDFKLTEAIRPFSSDVLGVNVVIPVEGYRLQEYVEETGFTIPLMCLAASAEKLWDVFTELLKPFDNELDVVIESFHENLGLSDIELRREEVDKVVLLSILEQFSDLLLNDGCTGISIMNSTAPLSEIRLDDHKCIIVYSEDQRVFESILADGGFGITKKSWMKFIPEGSHYHTSSPRYQDEFIELKEALGII